MLSDNRCEGYTASMGALVQLMTAISSDKPGVFTRAGLGSFLDPRNGGGRLNAISTEPLSKIMEVEDREYIFYPVQHIDVALIRGTVADENGYVSLEEESNLLATVDIAAAAKACGGKVFVQVERVVPAGSLDPQLVRIPGPLVDGIVVSPRDEGELASIGLPRDMRRATSGRERGSLDRARDVEPGTSRIILRRAAQELRPGDVINVGAGIPIHLPRILYYENLLDSVTITNEHGVFGGLLGSAFGESFVPSVNPAAIMDSSFQFNFYDGGGLDAAFLGMGQVDAAGNVNVSRFGALVNASGGFTNIIEHADRIVFCGTLTAGGLDVDVVDGQLVVKSEGKVGKFVREVDEVTFNASRALDKGQHVTYVTERAVFVLTPEGLVLTEVAPGVDAQRHVLDLMGFAPAAGPPPTSMPASAFGPSPLNLTPTDEEGTR